MTPLLITNGTIVTPSGSFTGTVAIENGKIISVDGHNDNILSGAKVLDASGKYVIPGGIDPHVHFHLKTPAGYSSDDFFTGSRAALYGGTTTVIDFVTPSRGQSIIEAVKKRKSEAQNCFTDYTFHVSPVEWNENTANELRRCIPEEKITSFKVYMAYKNSIGLDDDDIEKVMRVISKENGVLAIHCEMGEAIDVLQTLFTSEGHFTPDYHAFSRPAYLESEAVKTAVELAEKTDCKIYIVHTSAAKSLPYIKSGLEKGVSITTEICPQYLLLNEDKYKGDFYEVAPYIMSPPLRKKQDNEALWEALAGGTINTVGTDHCPFTMKQKETGTDDFRKIPNGAGGVEHRLELLYTYGVASGKLSLNRFVELISTNPAKVFGLYPRKGVIAPGSDADIVIFDPHSKHIISAKTHHQNTDINIYEGFEVTGKAVTVIKGGKIVLDNGKLITEKPEGKFIPRKSQPLI